MQHILIKTIRFRALLKKKKVIIKRNLYTIKVLDHVRTIYSFRVYPLNLLQFKGFFKCICVYKFIYKIPKTYEKGIIIDKYTCIIYSLYCMCKNKLAHMVYHLFISHTYKQTYNTYTKNKNEEIKNKIKTIRSYM